MTSLARRLIHRVEIEAETRTPDGAGGFTRTWARVGPGSVAAEIYGLSGAEAMKAGIERNVQQWRVTIRRRQDVTAEHRLQWLLATGNVRLDIKSVMADPKAPREATLLLCESGGG
jgi:SPP1 family predicted phage head-tail adaptor